MYPEKEIANYVCQGSHVSYSPGHFFVVWSDLDAPLLARPAFAARLQAARVQLMAAWCPLFDQMGMAHQSPTGAPPQIAEKLKDANENMRNVYLEAGFTIADTHTLMEVNRSLLVNALNNAMFLMHGPQVGSELPWTVRSGGLSFGTIQR